MFGHFTTLCMKGLNRYVFNPFVPNVPFPYALKKSENLNILVIVINVYPIKIFFKKIYIETLLHADAR